MPFCSQCGNQIGGRDAYCARCGSPQPVSPGPTAARPQPGDPLASLSPRTASILCYIPGLGWIGSIIVLASDKFRADRQSLPRIQGLTCSSPGCWTIGFTPNGTGMDARPCTTWFSRPAPFIFMMVKASHNQAYALPLFGELANRSVSED